MAQYLTPDKQLPARIQVRVGSVVARCPACDCTEFACATPEPKRASHSVLTCTHCARRSTRGALFAGAANDAAKLGAAAVSKLKTRQKAAQEALRAHAEAKSTEPAEPVVFVVDDDASMREALSSLLRSVGLRVKAFASAADFLWAPRPDAPACLVLDVRLPEISGLELQRALVAASDRIPIIFITGHGDIPMSVRAMKAGAVEFLTKPFSHRDLLDAVRHALERERRTRLLRSQDSQIKARYESLTAREREVLREVAAGRLNKQIAASLGVAEITVKVHRRRVMEKMRAVSLAELVRLVQRLEYTKV